MLWIGSAFDILRTVSRLWSNLLLPANIFPFFLDFFFWFFWDCFWDFVLTYCKPFPDCGATFFFPLISFLSYQTKALIQKVRTKIRETINQEPFQQELVLSTPFHHLWAIQRENQSNWISFLKRDCGIITQFLSWYFHWQKNPGWMVVCSQEMYYSILNVSWIFLNRCPLEPNSLSDYHSTSVHRENKRRKPFFSVCGFISIVC